MTVTNRRVNFPIRSYVWNRIKGIWKLLSKHAPPRDKEAADEAKSPV